MYERNAIVLERYLDRYFGFDKQINLKSNYQNYKGLIEEMKQYREVLIEEDGLINLFDEIARTIQEIQAKQSKLYENNIKLEEERNKLFNDLSEEPAKLDERMQKVEKIIESNNIELKQLREEYVKSLAIFIERQKARNKITRKRRVIEENHINFIENAKKIFAEIDINIAKRVKAFIDIETQGVVTELVNVMMKNGKNEKVGFNEQVIKKAVEVRISIAQKEAECYTIIYERTKRFFQEIETEEVKMAKHEKALRDISVKLAFLEAQKEYVVGFLDNERMTAISGPNVHEQMMKEACQGFDEDIAQINNLYELILRETVNKATKKAYKELYNNTYLRNIEAKEKSFEQEVNNITLRMGTLINSNYWRIEGIKHIYTTFQQEVGAKFEKDLSELKIESTEDAEELTQENDIENDEVEKPKKRTRRTKAQIEADKQAQKENEQQKVQKNNEEEFEDVKFEEDYEQNSNQKEAEKEDILNQIDFNDDEIDLDNQEENLAKQFDAKDAKESEYLEEDDDEDEEDFLGQYNTNTKKETQEEDEEDFLGKFNENPKKETSKEPEDNKKEENLEKHDTNTKQEIEEYDTLEEDSTNIIEQSEENEDYDEDDDEDFLGKFGTSSSSEDDEKKEQEEENYNMAQQYTSNIEVDRDEDLDEEFDNDILDDFDDDEFLEKANKSEDEGLPKKLKFGYDQNDNDDILKEFDFGYDDDDDDDEEDSLYQFDFNLDDDEEEKQEHSNNKHEEKEELKNKKPKNRIENKLNEDAKGLFNKLFKK